MPTDILPRSNMAEVQRRRRGPASRYHTPLAASEVNAKDQRDTSLPATLPATVPATSPRHGLRHKMSTLLHPIVSSDAITEDLSPMSSTNDAFASPSPTALSRRLNRYSEHRMQAERQMEMLMATIISDPWQSIASSHVGTLLRIFELYRRLCDENDHLHDKVEACQAENHKLTETYQLAAQDWAHGQHECKQEIKRLELILAREKRGFAEVRDARGLGAMYSDHAPYQMDTDRKESVIEFLTSSQDVSDMPRARSRDEIMIRGNQRAVFRSKEGCTTLRDTAARKGTVCNDQGPGASQVERKESVVEFLMSSNQLGSMNGNRNRQQIENMSRGNQRATFRSKASCPALGDKARSLNVSPDTDDTRRPSSTALTTSNIRETPSPSVFVRRPDTVESPSVMFDGNQTSHCNDAAYSAFSSVGDLLPDEEVHAAAPDMIVPAIDFRRMQPPSNKMDYDMLSETVSTPLPIHHQTYHERALPPVPTGPLHEPQIRSFKLQEDITGHPFRDSAFESQPADSGRFTYRVAFGYQNGRLIHRPESSDTQRSDHSATTGPLFRISTDTAPAACESEATNPAGAQPRPSSGASSIRSSIRRHGLVIETSAIAQLGMDQDVRSPIENPLTSPRPPVTHRPSSGSTMIPSPTFMSSHVRPRRETPSTTTPLMMTPETSLPSAPAVSRMSADTSTASNAGPERERMHTSTAPTGLPSAAT